MYKRSSMVLGFIFLTGHLLGAKERPGVPLYEPFDVGAATTTWRYLTHEQVMFPLSMRDMPVKIGTERQLLLDNYLIAYEDNLRRQVHRPQRYSGNPVLVPPSAPFNQIVVQHVLQFKNSPRFRMWYTSWDEWQVLPTGQRIRFSTSYATSEDGKTWIRPKLNLHQIEGLVHSENLVLPYGSMHGLFFDEADPDPNKRFKALVCVERKDPVVREGYYVHWSPDGIHWTGDLSRPVITSLTGSYRVPQNGVGDTSRFWWDPIRKKYVGDVKFVVEPNRQRCRGIMESDDLVHWTRPIPTSYARSDELQVYGQRGFAYQGAYIGMSWMYEPSHSTRHSSFVQLNCSRDGRIWTRVGAGQRFMDYNSNHDTWDATIMRPVSLLEVGDEVFIYYFAAPSELEVENPNYPESAPREWSMGLATLLRDRFASLNADENSGSLITRPLSFCGHTLHLNAEITEQGELTVAALDFDRQPLAGFNHDDCKLLRGDSINLRVEWQNGSDLSRLEEADFVRFEFRLRNAKLYSFWVD